MLLDLLAQTEPDTGAVSQAVPEGLQASDWLQAGIIVVAAVVVAIVAQKLVGRTLGRRSEESANLIGRISAIVVFVVGFIYALSSIGVDVGLLVGALGVGGIVLALAFQDILENFVAGVILQLKRPFKTGAYVEIGEETMFGVVHEIDSRSVILHTFSGERLVIPAAKVLKFPIINWTVRGRRRMTVDIGIHYRHDPEDAIDAITPRLDEIDEVLAAPPPRVLLTDLGDSSVQLTAYVWHDAFADVFWIKHRVVQETKRALDEAGIEIPFPQRVLSFSPDRGANVIDVRDGGARAEAREVGFDDG